MQVRVPYFRFLLLLVLGCPAKGQTTHTYQPSAADFPNPERGLYVWGELTTPGTWYQGIRDQGYTLAYARILLSCCRDSAVDSQTLAVIRANFSAMRAAGVKGIVRISYNDALSGEDASLEWMDVHLGQLAPIFEANKDVIAFFQAGMIGAWGEWHSSASGHDTPAGRAAVWRLLLQHLPDCLPIQVRTPGFIRELEATAPAAVGNCSSAARIAHHNDCWLANETDGGTYGAGQREFWLTEMETDARLSPWGGETCCLETPCLVANTLGRCEVALSEAPRLGAVYLSDSWHPDMLRALEPCWAELSRGLGYRFQWVSAQLPERLRGGAPFSWSIHLQNVGYAPLSKARPVYLLLLGEDGGDVLARYPLEADVRTWTPGDHHLSGRFVAPACLGVDQARLALWLPDAAASIAERPEYAVRFANRNTSNADVWEAATGYNRLAEGIPVDDTLGVRVTPGAHLAQGRDPLVLTAAATCSSGALSFAWVNPETGVPAGHSAGITLPVLTETTRYRVTVTDARFTRERDVRVLATANPLFRDVNGDGCNDVADLWALAATWGDGMADDADGNRRVDVRDLLFINIHPQTPCAAR
ncbi:DUF4874 domain-containing protein [Acanthopleuribacter pedis]|uniref:DUF4874 domain-containing protein n=1 Tax=Acanthopleuribacter pedis TaxID=442870 RepID=A0A8J7QC51_9BACT|nr:DUF4874 domain-containing protein [Acanthopleuribacter pedis]MBO1321399.1 DUF4874 domain-containing protein [Acanthopleuribacter pedis]